MIVRPDAPYIAFAAENEHQKCLSYNANCYTQRLSIDMPLLRGMISMFRGLYDAYEPRGDRLMPYSVPRCRQFHTEIILQKYERKTHSRRENVSSFSFSPLEYAQLCGLRSVQPKAHSSPSSASACINAVNKILVKLQRT